MSKNESAASNTFPHDDTMREMLFVKVVEYSSVEQLYNYMKKVLSNDYIYENSWLLAGVSLNFKKR